METELRSDPARALLAPLAIRGALRYLNAEGSEVRPDRIELTAEQPGLEDVRRQGISPRLLRTADPTAAVLICPTRQAMRDLGVLRQNNVPTLILRDTVLDADFAAYFSDVEDPTERLLQETPEGRWSRPHDPDAIRPVVPYPYVMQRLVAEWTGPARTHQ
jgi:hypothetical protein